MISGFKNTGARINLRAPSDLSPPHSLIDLFVVEAEEMKQLVHVVRRRLTVIFNKFKCYRVAILVIGTRRRLDYAQDRAVW